jgi:hypothetical protein
VTTTVDKKEGYQTNTNLEQISDWLTKILVGVGLTEFGNVPSFLMKFANFVGPGLGDFSNSKIFAISLLIYFIILGFLAGYLWTRLFIAGAFRAADIQGQLDELKITKENDNKALIMIQRQLHTKQDKPYTQDEITEIIRNTSNDVRSQIYYKAESFRHENSRDASDMNYDVINMNKVIMIFRGLIETDENKVFYKNHGQLGFALIDLDKPEYYEEAKKELTKAIEMRPQRDKSEWLDFEGYRALCRIKTDKEFNSKLKSTSSAQKEIITDLKEALKGLTNFRENSVITEWLHINSLDWDKIANG